MCVLRVVPPIRVNAEQLFVRFFLPLYPPEVRAGGADGLARARAEDANPAANPTIFAHLSDAADQFVHNARALFDGDLGLDRSDASVHRIAASLTRQRRDAWMAEGAPGTAESVLFNAVVHGAAYVGACIVESHGGAWSVRRPMWESVVRLRSRAGEADLAVFHWWLKSLADDALAGTEPAMSATLADRHRSHVEVPCARPEDLPVMLAGARSLPRLKKPRYDRLYKYLRAHLPELRDLGVDFPTPERFEAYGFRWMDFHVVGGGRMLVCAGASPKGLHLFWLSAGGFEKSAFLACDAFPDPLVRVEGDRLVTLTSESGTARVHEMLWWGP